MGKLSIYAILLLVLVATVQKSLGLKCYICNTADQSDGTKEEHCRYPDKYSEYIKPKECDAAAFTALKAKWMNEGWNFNHFNSHSPYNVNQDQPQGAAAPAAPQRHDYGSEGKPGYTLKCMKEVLHKDSANKEWLRQQDTNFSQIVRFCEYRKDKEEPPCDKPCTEEQKSKTGCFLCCTGDGCNAATGLVISPLATVVAMATSIFVLVASMSKVRAN